MGTVVYKEFKLGDLFSIESSKKKYNANSIKLNGEYPYVVRSSLNNGIKGYTTQDVKYLNDANTISFGQDTATIFYQEKPYFTGDKIKVLKYKEKKLDRRLAMYLITLMRKAFMNFIWGQASFNENVLKNMSIQLPVKDEETIDYKYISDYIRNIEKEYEKEITKDYEISKKRYLEVLGINNLNYTKEESKIKADKKDVKFKEFTIEEIFESFTGDFDIQKKHINGNGVNVVSSGSKNNGIVGRTDVKAKKFSKNTITIDMFGNVFFQDQDYKMVTHARVFSIKFKDKELTKEEGMYLVAKLNYFNKMFSYDNMASWEKIKQIKIEMPIIKDKIDYKYINDYMRLNEKELILELLETKRKFLQEICKIK